MTPENKNRKNWTAVFQELADIATCVSGDLHTLHFNMHGAEFDELHGHVLKKYYEEAANDADEFGEWSAAFGSNYAVKNPNEAAVRIKWQKDQSIEDTLDGACDRAGVISRVDDLIEKLCAAYLTVFKVLEKENCPLCVGAANLIQSRLEYWAKELAYFNKRRA